MKKKKSKEEEEQTENILSLEKKVRHATVGVFRVFGFEWS
jgi:hypothetical protein